MTRASEDSFIARLDIFENAMNFSYRLYGMQAHLSLPSFVTNLSVNSHVYKDELQQWLSSEFFCGSLVTQAALWPSISASLVANAEDG